MFGRKPKDEKNDKTGAPKSSPPSPPKKMVSTTKDKESSLQQFEKRGFDSGFVYYEE